MECAGDLPPWLSKPQGYAPTGDRDGFLTRSLLHLSSTLAQLRLDEGRQTPWSPSAVAKLAFALVCLVLTSLSRNYLFVLTMLAGVLVRACLLPARTLRRLATVAGGAAALTLVIMLPATLLGQPRSALTLATKALVSVGITMEVALTTPAAELTGALRRVGIPSIVILTLDLTLRSIVSLGTVAAETLTALRLRSVGRNADKGGAMGGVGGVVLVRAAITSRDTYDAMRCRCFTGTYEAASTPVRPVADVACAVAIVALIALFAHLQGAV